jgi:hypothetical protein
MFSSFLPHGSENILVIDELKAFCSRMIIADERITKPRRIKTP